MAETTAVTTAAIAAMPPSCTPTIHLIKRVSRSPMLLARSAFGRQGVQPTLYVANPLFQCRHDLFPPNVAQPLSYLNNT